MEKSPQYIVQDKTIFFDPEYNELFDTEILEVMLHSNTIRFDKYPGKMKYSNLRELKKQKKKRKKLSAGADVECSRWHEYVEHTRCNHDNQDGN